LDLKTKRASQSAGPQGQDGNHPLKPEWRMGEHGVPVARYVDKDFARLEAEKLWPHTWQVACRQEEIPNPGDYTVYDILDQSIFVVRQGNMSVKAFKNVCPHRGTALAAGAGRFQLEQIVCPFHGWKWNLQGQNNFILDQPEFLGGCLKHEDVNLKECQVGLFLNCVWINMDPAAESFDDYIAPLRDRLDPLLVDRMYFHWHKSVVLKANWKVAQEAFFEGYHVPQTHPQLVKRQIKSRPDVDMQTGQGIRRINSHISAFPQGHAIQGSLDGGVRGLGRFPKEWMEGMSREEQVEALIRFHAEFYDEIQSMTLADDVEVARTMRHRPIPEDSGVDAEFQQAIREHYALQGRAIAPAEALSRVGTCHIFPNYTFLPMYGNVLIYRSRPSPDNDPDRCIFEIWSCRTYAEGEKPPRPQVEHVLDPMDPNQMCLFLRQDFSNIPRQQLGMHSMGIKSTLLNATQEEFISNMHQALDRALER